MKKLLLLSLLFLSSLLSLNASGTYSGVSFTDYEENATIYFVNYYSYQNLKGVLNSSSTSNKILSHRKDDLFTSIPEIDDISGVNTQRLHNLKQQGHLIDWNVYTDDFGLTLHQTNFLYGLTGVLIGFVFLFGFIQILIGGGI